MSPNFISLFAGIGGIDLGLERAGFECIAQVEWDDFCQSILQKHWPAVQKFQDIKDITNEQLIELGPVDLIAGGFPCQPVSLAGRQKAQEDERWLWPEFARIIRTVRPRVVFVENVPGLLTANAGEAFGEVQGDLASLGYDTEWEVIPASAFGAPHIRKRVALVAYASGERRQQIAGSPFSDESSNGRWSEENHLSKCDGEGGGQESSSASDVADPDPLHRSGRSRVLRSPGWAESSHGGRWAIEPDVGRMVNGVPRRVDRLKALGNAVVPQFAEYVGNCIMQEFFL